jgi:PatG Domain
MASERNGGAVFRIRLPQRRRGSGRLEDAVERVTDVVSVQPCGGTSRSRAGETMNGIHETAGSADAGESGAGEVRSVLGVAAGVASSAGTSTSLPQSVCSNCNRPDFSSLRWRSWKPPPDDRGQWPFYVLGRIGARFPNESIEKELAQGTRRAETVGLSDREAMQTVLPAPGYAWVARQLCWVLTIKKQVT